MPITVHKWESSHSVPTRMRQYKYICTSTHCLALPGMSLFPFLSTWQKDTHWEQSSPVGASTPKLTQAFNFPESTSFTKHSIFLNHRYTKARRSRSPKPSPGCMYVCMHIFTWRHRMSTRKLLRKPNAYLHPYDCLCAQTVSYAWGQITTSSKKVIKWRLPLRGKIKSFQIQRGDVRKTPKQHITNTTSWNVGLPTLRWTSRQFSGEVTLAQMVSESGRSQASTFCWSSVIRRGKYDNTMILPAGSGTLCTASSGTGRESSRTQHYTVVSMCTIPGSSIHLSPRAKVLLRRQISPCSANMSSPGANNVHLQWPD